MIRLTLCACLLALLVSSSAAHAQPTLSHAQPSALLPSGMSRIHLHGDKMTPPLRVWTSAPAQVSVVELTPQKAVLDVAPIGPSFPLGTLGISVATSDGVAAPIALLVDSLPSIVETTDNHSAVSAQTIGSALAIDAASNGKLFDYFRFHALAGQSLSFEVLAQPLGSAFDAVVRILNEQGEPLVTVDDDSVSPDCRFRHRFEKTGNYIIEVHDNKYAAGGRYRLRIGNFPLVNFAFPAYATRGSQIELTFGGVDREAVLPQTVAVPTDPWQESFSVTAMAKDGSTAAALVRLANQKQFTESEPNNTAETSNSLEDALGINGMLATPGDRDSFKVMGVKDQTWRFAAKARSFGSPTMLKMQLKNAAGEVVAKTAVADSDEWQFDFKFPADASYTLECEDLLRRGGPEFAYHVDLGIAPPFSLALKPDAKTRERLVLQPTAGAGNIDLVVTRTWNNGPIELQFEPKVPGLIFINPIIPAGAKEHQLLLQTTPEWKAQNISGVRLIGKALEAPEATAAVSTAALAVVRAPHVPYPSPWLDGLLMLAGVNDEAPYFEMTGSSDPVALARPLSDGSFSLTIKRVKPEFKEGVILAKSELPPQWSATTKLDKDTLTIVVKHPVTATPEPVSLKFWWYGNLSGRGQLFMSETKVRLFEPLQITTANVPAIKRGEMQKLAIEVKREGGEPQPVVLKLANLPAGISAPESVTIPANENKTEVPLSASGEAVVGKTASTIVSGTTKLGDKEIGATSPAVELEVN